MSNTQGVNKSAQAIKSLEDPPAAKALFGDVRWAWLWLVLRLYVGYQWITAGWEKLHASAWTGAKAGTAMAGFVNGALTKTAGDHPDVQGWYAWFLRNLVLTHTSTWSYMISWGETLVGIALILGIFTGIAAFFGGLMNVNYLLAGTVSINPVLFVLELFLVLAWKTAGWYGLDRWMLPALGTPWRPGFIFYGQELVPQQKAQPAGED